MSNVLSDEKQQQVIGIRQTKDTFQAGRASDAVVAWTNNENGEDAGEPARKPTE